MNTIYIHFLMLAFICTAHRNESIVAAPGETYDPEIRTDSPSHWQTTEDGVRANFSGKWKLNVSKSETGRYGTGDKTCLSWLSASRTLQIEYCATYLTMDVVTYSIDGTPTSRQEKLKLDGSMEEAALLATIIKKASVRWSQDGQLMYVSATTNYHRLKIQTLDIWQLTNGGKNLLIQSNSNSGENVMKLVYDRVAKH